MSSFACSEEVEIENHRECSYTKNNKIMRLTSKAALPRSSFPVTWSAMQKACS